MRELRRNGMILDHSSIYLFTTEYNLHVTDVFTMCIGDVVWCRKCFSNGAVNAIYVDVELLLLDGVPFADCSSTIFNKVFF